MMQFSIKKSLKIPKGWSDSVYRISTGTPVSSTNKSDHHDITEILLIVALNTINQHSLL